METKLNSRISARIPLDLRQDVEDLAASKHTSTATITRQALYWYVNVMRYDNTRPGTTVFPYAPADEGPIINS